MSRRSARGALLVAAVLVLGACDDEPETRAPALPDVEPIPGSPAAAARATPGEPATVADIFPATGTRGLVLNNCATCHPVACTAIGQRTPQRWREIEATHTGAVAGLSAEDRGRIFDYLRRNFNDTLPEPRVPPEYLEGGCTP